MLFKNDEVSLKLEILRYDGDRPSYITISLTLLKLMATELVMPPNYHILCPHLFLPSISQHQGLFQ